MVQRPADLDTACTLALLQEEALKPVHRKEFCKSDTSVFSKMATIKGALPPPPPLPRLQGAPDDKTMAHAPVGSSTDAKLSALRSYRKSRGLCIRCGDKWHPGHKCAANLQLHVLQEIFDLCHENFIGDVSEEDQSPDEDGQLNMLLSAFVW
jgi:hypothetical protein